ncbi:hypothetical protein SLS62_004279 [Diatrype stigma]|uniref:NmrA-like domain-containing protein n=1 Tax=Diatrype stigma TaxID=117547 RepID=A0AAN9UUS0_9PEZI
MASEATIKKTIAVVGATGTQGSSVARTFAPLPHWHVRCLTRTPSSPKAQALAALGCEVVAADLGDVASLRRAFDGAHAIFLNTDFWGPFRAQVAQGAGDAVRSAFDVEVSHGRNAVLAAASDSATLERLVYSALGPMKAASRGKYGDSYHWEAKASVVRHIEEEEEEVVARRTSYIYVGAYCTNGLFYPKRDPGTGEYRLVLPGRSATRFPLIDAERSVGKFVRALVESEPPRTRLLAYDSFLSVDEVLAAWSRVTGREARFVQVTLEEMQKLTGLPKEVLIGPAYVDEFGYTAGVDNVVGPEDLKVKVETPGWEEWLRTRDVQELLQK